MCGQIPPPPPSLVEDVSSQLKFNNKGKDLKKILSKKRQTHGSSLIGSVADLVESATRTDDEFSLCTGERYWINFKKVGGENSNVMAIFGKNKSSYTEIIREMTINKKATRRTAAQMLAKLSLPNTLDNTYLFHGLNIYAKKLMALLICETIRFKDNGAFAKWAIRLVLDKFLKGANENPNAFEIVFGNDQLYPQAIFANKGGTRRTLNLFSNSELNPTNSWLDDFDSNFLQDNIDFLSDYENPDI